MIQDIFMFVEDVSRLMPLHRTGSNGLSVLMAGTEGAQRKALQVLDELSGHEGGSPRDRLARAVNNLAKGIAWEGRVQFELIPRDDGTTCFHQVTTKGLFRLFGFAIQYLKPDDRRFWKSRAVRWVALATMWHIDVPRSLGGRLGYRRLLSSLRRYNPLGPGFFLADMQAGGNPSRVDIGAYARANNISRFKLTQSWGWNCRDLSNRLTTEFYDIYRGAAAMRSQCLFRNHIVCEINALLKRLAIDCTISVEGLPSAEDAERMMYELVTGQLSFKEFLDIKFGR